MQENLTTITYRPDYVRTTNEGERHRSKAERHRIAQQNAVRRKNIAVCWECPKFGVSGCGLDEMKRCPYIVGFEEERQKHLARKNELRRARLGRMTPEELRALRQKEAERSAEYRKNHPKKSRTESVKNENPVQDR